MKVSRLMSQSVEQTTADATVMDTAILMKNLDVGLLPVFDRDELVGVITDRDIVCRAVAEGLDPTEVLVRDIMTEEIFSCFDDEDDREAARIMQEHQVHRLLVLDHGHRVLGICSLADIARGSRDRDVTAGEVEDVVQPSGSSRR